MSKLHFLFAAAALSAAVSLSPALAQDDGVQSKTIVISLHDHPMKTESQRAALDARLQTAAKKACRRAGDHMRVLSDRAEQKQCIDRAMSEAYAAITTARPYASAK